MWKNLIVQLKKLWKMKKLRGRVTEVTCKFWKGKRSISERIFIMRNKFLKFQIPNSKFQIPNSKFQIPNSTFQIPNSKFQIPNPKFQISNHKSQISNSKSLKFQQSKNPNIQNACFNPKSKKSIGNN